MKKIYILLLFLFTSIVLCTSNAYAVTNKITTTVSPTISLTASPSGAKNPDLMNKIDQQINSLKTRIASRVAQLNLVEKRGIVGIVMEASGTQIKLTDIQNNIRFIDVDELTKFSSPSAKDSFGISDLTKGTKVGVLGNYNKDSQRILARFIDVVSFPKTMSGIVDSVDKKNYQFNITTVDQESLLIDNEVVTKTFVYTAADGLKKAGFSKIDKNQRVYIVGFSDKNVKNKIIASRIILFPELSPTSSVSASPTISEKITPTKKK